ncbi:hypothetical protein AMECASPLE_021864 [Ameca splendens]|uniref:Uncharacterized protein n=1 Tax=Ameca splendens TaxID=208324 RepID=A0ABV0YRV8_9TELE
MSNFVLSLFIFHPELLCFLCGEFNVLPPRPSTPYNPLISSFDIFCSALFCYVLLCSFPMCLIALLLFPLPSFCCCSVSSGLRVAPAHTSTRHEAVRVWLESLSGELCEDEELEAEADSPDMEPGTELDQDDIPSDAEAEARLHQAEEKEAASEENEAESLGRDSSIGKLSCRKVILCPSLQSFAASSRPFQHQPGAEGRHRSFSPQDVD